MIMLDRIDHTFLQFKVRTTHLKTMTLCHEAHSGHVDDSTALLRAVTSPRVSDSQP